MTVELTPDAAAQLEDLPLRIRGRVMRILERLADWPETSGARPLRGELVGHWRIRTGDGGASSFMLPAMR